MTYITKDVKFIQIFTEKGNSKGGAAYRQKNIIASASDQPSWTFRCNSWLGAIRLGFFFYWVYQQLLWWMEGYSLEQGMQHILWWDTCNRKHGLYIRSHQASTRLDQTAQTLLLCLLPSLCIKNAFTKSNWSWTTIFFSTCSVHSCIQPSFASCHLLHCVTLRCKKKIPGGIAEFTAFLPLACTLISISESTLQLDMNA